MGKKILDVIVKILTGDVMKKWRAVPWHIDTCPDCGDELEVYTMADAGYYMDGDKVRCQTCTFFSMLTVMENGEVYVQD